jgi:uncharacterized protein (TIGR00290 family)
VLLPTTVKPKAVVCWSGGKDSALALWKAAPAYDVVGLVTTITESFQRVSMHGVRRELVEQQAQALGLPLHLVSVPWPCTNEIYEERMRAAFANLIAAGVEKVICGDIFLEDVRRYREERLLGPNMGVFPLWHIDTRELMRQFCAAGFRAVLCCVDNQALPAEFAGRSLDDQLVRDLPAGADPCGENGEYHSFVYAAPMFAREIGIECGERVLRDGRFAYCDLLTSLRAADLQAKCDTPR